MEKETVVALGSNYPVTGQTVYRRYTQVWQKLNGNWILTARQARNIRE